MGRPFWQRSSRSISLQVGWIKDKMYCLPGSRRGEQVWWREDALFTKLKQVLSAVEDYFDVVFVDCGARKDDIARNLLQEADVCVLNMDQ